MISGLSFWLHLPLHHPGNSQGVNRSRIWRHSSLGRWTRVEENFSAKEQNLMFAFLQNVQSDFNLKNASLYSFVA